MNLFLVCIFKYLHKSEHLAKDNMFLQFSASSTPLFITWNLWIYLIQNFKHKSIWKNNKNFKKPIGCFFDCTITFNSTFKKIKINKRTWNLRFWNNSKELVIQVKVFWLVEFWESRLWIKTNSFSFFCKLPPETQGIPNLYMVDIFLWEKRELPNLDSVESLIIEHLFIIEHFLIFSHSLIKLSNFCVTGHAN